MASPLTLIMPIIPGTSIQTIVGALAQYGPQLDAALQSIGTVHYARTLFFDRSQPNLQPGMNPNPNDSFAIAIITEFDGSFDAYIQDFVSQVGTVFDALLQFVVGGAAITPVANNVQAFEQFITTNDASQNPPNTGMFQAYTFTVQQILANG